RHDPSRSRRFEENERRFFLKWGKTRPSRIDWMLPPGTGAGAVTNLFNSRTTDDKKAWTALLELGVMPGRATVAAAYRRGETGAAANNVQTATTLGATYLFTQNVEFMINHTWYNGSYYDLTANNEDKTGDQLTTFMMFAAF
ncbi:MAG: hypothetical protein AAB210_05240, partial [Deltaproteobacteria bacterium]